MSKSKTSTELMTAESYSRGDGGQRRSDLPGGVLHRRHLTPSQLSMCAARAEGIYKKAAEERMLAGKRINPSANLREGSAGKTSDNAAKAFGISGRSVEYAKNVLEKGTPEDLCLTQASRFAIVRAPGKDCRLVTDGPLTMNNSGTIICF